MCEEATAVCSWADTVTVARFPVHVVGQLEFGEGRVKAGQSICTPWQFTAVSRWIDMFTVRGWLNVVTASCCPAGEMSQVEFGTGEK